MCQVSSDSDNSLAPNRKRVFADDTFKPIFLNENVRISIKISLKFVPKAPINNIPALVQIMTWRRPGDKPLSEPMMVWLLMHICVARPQWVNTLPYVTEMLFVKSDKIVLGNGPSNNQNHGKSQYKQAFHDDAMTWKRFPLYWSPPSTKAGMHNFWVFWVISYEKLLDKQLSYRWL